MRSPTWALFALACATQPVPPPVAAAQATDPVAAAGIPVRDDGVVRVEGAPEVPEALMQELRRYLEPRSAAAAELSPDGSKLLIRTRFSQTAQVHLVDHPMGARTQLTFAPEPVRGAAWTPDGQVMLVADVGGDEQYQLVRLDPATGTESLVTDGKSRHGAAQFSNDGSQLVFTSNARNGKDMDLWLSDGRDPASARLLAEAEGHWNVLAWSPDDQRLLVEEYRSITDSTIFEVSVADGALHPVSPPEPVAAHWNAVYGPDTQTIYISSDRGGEFVSLYKVDRRDDTWTPLTEDLRWNVEHLARLADGQTLLFSVNEEGYNSLFTMDMGTGQRTPVEGLPAGVIRDLRAARDVPRASLSLYAPNSPGNAWVFDLDGRSVQPWTNAEVGGLNPAGFVVPELVHYDTFDGKQIPCFVYKPPGPGPHPVVIRIHGGPEAQARPYFSGSTQYLVQEAGVVVLIPNVRGSNGYGKSWLKLDNGFKREDSVKDIGALLDWVQAQPSLDADRVAVTGGSYGGYMVLASLMHYSDRLRGGMDVVGIANFVTFLENTKPYRQDLRRPEYGDERDPEMRAHLEKISPVNNVDRITAPLFVVHGANDPRVPVGEAEQIVAAVRAAGREAWYMLARNEGHGMGKKANRDLYLALQVMFLREQLDLE